jgi:hypothetical protein
MDWYGAPRDAFLESRDRSREALNRSVGPLNGYRMTLYRYSGPLNRYGEPLDLSGGPLNRFVEGRQLFHLPQDGLAS